ncbi:MAG: hypothetical protein CL467_04030 [Acidimicrobiaceae bacterium]|mgnify:CR=1 FL=1|nr:hypothetical protein [Acidimicrobiaceae bacterium]|tara:strand:- start:203 stop:1177 length:975 start_codon:yes stop_codon:yes gene_type:complete
MGPEMNASQRAIAAVIGVGQLGSRHVQGLASCVSGLDLHLVDPSSSSLDAAMERWSQMAPSPIHRIETHRRLDELPNLLDLVVVACNAAERAAVVSALAASRTVGQWVLEKVLACDVEGLRVISEATDQADGAWVNTPRRMLDWYARIGDKGVAGRPVEMEVTGGGWGLACNAIHFLDLAVWWSGSEVVAIDTGGLRDEWKLARRDGYLEVEGRLHATMADGGYVSMIDEGSGDRAINLRTWSGDWRIDESAGRAFREDGLEVSGRLELQSELTGPLAEEIFSTGACRLPTVTESVRAHQVLLEALLDHRRRTGVPNASMVPIT